MIAARRRQSVVVELFLHMYNTNINPTATLHAILIRNVFITNFISFLTSTLFNAKNRDW